MHTIDFIFLYKFEYKVSASEKENDDNFESTMVEELTPSTVVNDACMYYKSVPVITVEKV